MYLNAISLLTGPIGIIRLTLTLDVFKCMRKPIYNKDGSWLTLTLDVFKYLEGGERIYNARRLTLTLDVFK